MLLALIRRVSASPHGRRSFLSVETRAATLESSMHRSDNNDMSPLFPFPHAPHLPILQRAPSFFPFTWSPCNEFLRETGCMTTQISPSLGIVLVCQTCSRDRRNLVQEHPDHNVLKNRPSRSEQATRLKRLRLMTLCVERAPGDTRYFT